MGQRCDGLKKGLHLLLNLAQRAVTLRPIKLSWNTYLRHTTGGNMLKRALFLTVISIILTSVASAHHGWRWTTGNNIELTGIIADVKLGNPHGVLKIQSEDELWTVEVGQPYRNERAGLKTGDLAVNVEVKIEGEPSANLDEKLMKAE